MSISNVIFDLDGTLIDSADAILSSLQASFSFVGVHPIRPLSPDIIGPPLGDMLALLLGASQIAKRDSLALAFMEHYDVIGYKNTLPFEGISTLLDELAACSAKLYIATNKRIRPTRHIIEWLGWGTKFCGVYSLDNISPNASSKADIIQHIIRLHRLDANTTLYVGDRDEDAMAASQAQVHFLKAQWGYSMERNAKKGMNDASDINLFKLNLLAQLNSNLSDNIILY